MVFVHIYLTIHCLTGRQHGLSGPAPDTAALQLSRVSELLWLLEFVGFLLYVIGLSKVDECRLPRHELLPGPLFIAEVAMAEPSLMC